MTLHLRTASLLLLAPLLSCFGQLYDDVECDWELGELDFSEAAQLMGDWCDEDWRRFNFDEEARLRYIDRTFSDHPSYLDADRFGCRAGSWPLVLGEYTTQGGIPEGGQSGVSGKGMSRKLVDAQITSELVFLQYEVISPEFSHDEHHVFLFEYDLESDTLVHHYSSYRDQNEPLTLDEVRADDQYGYAVTTLSRCGV